MSFSALRETILDRDLCTSCGVCVVACPERVIRMDELVPKLVLADGATDPCASCTDCVDVCPGADPCTPELEPAIVGRRRTDDERWLGVYRGLAGARAGDDALYQRSGGGGTTSALARHAMEHLGLDWLVLCGRDEQRPWRSAPVVCRDPARVGDYAQSSYQLAPHLTGLDAVLRDAPSRGGLVGLACHIQGVRKLQRLDSEIGRRARDRICIAIEIACSSSTLPSGTETLIEDDLGLRLDDVREVVYRDASLPGVAYPGVFRVTTKAGTHHTLPLYHAFRNFKDHKTHRCLSCPDWLSGLADLSIFDGDPNIFEASLAGKSRYEKHGTVLVRTETGSRVLASAIETGALLAWETELAARSNNLGLERKRNRRATYERTEVPIPEAPIRGYRETGEVIDDARLLEIPAHLRSNKRNRVE